MRKRILCLVLALLMMLSFCACHGSKGIAAFTVPSAFDESKSYEISFWAKNDTNKTQVDIYDKAVADFEALYPNIKVTVRYYTDYNTIYNDVITNIATGTTPNVCITYPDHIATYLTGDNVVAPLDELFTDSKYGFGGAEIKYDSIKQSDVVETFLEEGKFDGHYYAIPYMRSTEACYVNKTFVEKLGYELPKTLTWDFIWEVSEAAMAQDADGNFLVNGQKVLIPCIYKSTDNMMIQMLYQKGADYSTENGDILLFNDTTKDFLYEISKHARTKAFSTFKISSYPANFLNAGQCIFAIDSTAGATWMGSNAPMIDIAADKLVQFETAVMTIPQCDVNKPLMISQGPSVCIFNKADHNEVLASWLFAQFLLTDDVQMAYAKTEGYVPVTTKAQSNPEYTDYLSREGEDNTTYYDVKIKATKLLIENTKNTFTTPVFNGSASLRNAAGQLIEEVTKSERRKETVDESYMENLKQRVSSLYRLGEVTTAAGGKQDLGPLPKTSVILLSTIVFAWFLIALIFLLKYNRRVNKRK